MSKSKEKLPINLENECPVEFHWGTFCRQALQEPGNTDFSLITVLPTLKMIMKGSGPLPEIIPLETMCVYTVFKRKPNFSGTLQIPLEIEIDFPGRKSEAGRNILVLGPDHNFCQSVVKLINPAIAVPLKLGIQEFTCQTLLRFGNSEIASVLLPLTVEVSNVDA